MNRLLSIKRVSDYRAMQSWTPPADLREFCQYNVIFGVNGTGKSTIASLLRNAITDDAWSSGMEVGVQVEEQEPRNVSGHTDPFWSCVRVFNNEYVEKNLRFANETGGTTEPLLVLGEERIGAEEERAAATARLEEIAQELPTRNANKRDAEAKRDKIATDTARTISEELQGTASKYAARSYNARVVRQLIESGVSVVPNLDVARELRVAQAAALPQCVLPSVRAFSVDDLIEGVREVLGERALSVVINELAEHPEWSRWVEAGLVLHEGQTTCIFCGSPVSADRRHALDAHFDESLQALQRRLDDMIDKLTSIQQRCSQAIKSLPQPDLITEKFRASYTNALEPLIDAKDAFENGVLGLIGELNKKRDGMFTSQTLKVVPEVSSLSLEGVAAIVEQHNTYVDDHETHRKEAAERVENARVAAVASEYQALDAAATDEAQALTLLKDESSQLDRVLRQAAVVDLDPVPMADRLNEDLSHLLGRDDLSFTSDERGYRIVRDGLPASHLSEGERNAVSLLYFLRSLEVHDTDQANCVVIIDDPVSSLDQNSLVGASALLWSRLVGRCGQLIMLTHNFELFRTWSYQLNNSGSATKPFGLYEMRSAVVVGRNGLRRRQPALVNWPYDYFMQKRLRSEYHYLFWTVLHTLDDCAANPTPEKEVAAAALLPNVCRRLLEAFLAFRQPGGVGNLSEQVRQVAPDAVTADVRTRALRFVHTYSHNEEADVSQPIARPETLDNVRAVLEFMKAVDLDHFEGMRAALEVGDGGIAVTADTAAA
jgi:wobble nucleotide-excising tRNase